LYSFEGAQSYSGLVQAANGDLYGTTNSGGAYNYGTIYKITPAGVFTVLYSFGSTDGANPVAGLLQATDGDLYGTTQNGGAYNYGTIYKITPAGAFRVLYSFGFREGANPSGGLLQATDSDLYGTTQNGGAYNYGTIYKITPDGLTTLHNFDRSDGANPYAGLMQATDGDFYGTTYFGGANNSGTVFKLSVGLAPFVKTLPAVGFVGLPVRILGTDLTGATCVTFNGTPAEFIVVSPTQILTRVPAGATTGSVQVVTPSGTLSSNVAFRVVP